MVQQKVLHFNSMITYDAWLSLHKERVVITSISAPEETFAYILAYQLPLPVMTVNYLEFPND